MSNVPELVPLFATPLVIFDVPDAAALNAELRKVIEQREKSHPTTQHSNQGGWQSSHDMDRWGGAPAIKLLAIGRNTANRMTTDREGKPVNSPYPGYFAVTWGANMWANVNRSGHGNEFHSHPGGYWSGVFRRRWRHRRRSVAGRRARVHGSARTDAGDLCPASRRRHAGRPEGRRQRER